MKKKKIIRGAAVAAMVCISAACLPSSLSAKAQNPIAQTSFSPDPAPVVFGDELYVFTGRDRDGDNDFYKMVGWQCFSTKDMQNWTDHGMILKDNEFSWCNENDAWASQCIERDGKYYFYFTTTDPGGRGRAIGVAVADKPEGPYRDVLGKPICGPNWDYIDPTVIIDDDGQAWLMFGNPTCYYVKLKNDMVTLDGQIQKFDMTEQAFGPNSDSKRASAYGEGPWIYKHNDLYYMVYAAFVGADSGESMAYATGPSVTGPWTYRGQIQKGSNCFTIHGGIIDYKDHSYYFYHMNGLPGGGVFNRSAACEEFTFNPDGTIPLIASTKNGPTQLESVNPYIRQEAEMMSWSSGIKTEKIDAGTLAIGFIENGDYTKISGVDFGDKGAAEFYASVASNGQGGKIEVHLDSETGPIVGTVDCPVTDGWQNWVTVSGKVSGAEGKHDVFLRFSGGDSYLFNVDWWQFVEKGDTSSKPGQIVNEDGGVITQNKDSGILGDYNGDGIINAVDLSYAKMLMLTGATNSKTIKPADVDENRVIENQEGDLEWYQKYLMTRVKDYPEKKASAEPEPAPYMYNSAVSFHRAPEQNGKNYFKDQPVNHGQVIQENYTGINGAKKMYVYVPYGYDESKKYNVFYLMHGGGESEETCFNDDGINIDVMLDNMIANGDIEPMIVVTPTFNKSPDGAGDVWKEMRETIIPYVENKYSTYAENTSIEGLKASRYHRAYGGFSMGGGSTWRMFCNNLDICAYYMPLSGHSWDGASGVQNAIDRFGFKKDEYFIFAATGTGDIAYGNMVPLIDALKGDTKRFTYTSDFSKGNLYFLEAPNETHWWGIVRHYVYDALPNFFHEHQNG
ncbi:MAG: family 43 glycosylhydrolase [Oscillospiraceae bacterium]|nr:family 43 glycosylhydrolase [Oscillospiraceae bacterium]